MLDTTVDPSHPRSGLAQAEQNDLAAATRWLPPGWTISFETTEIEEVYARIVPPWNPRVSAFLIDREAHGVDRPQTGVGDDDDAIGGQRVRERDGVAVVGDR